MRVLEILFIVQLLRGENLIKVVFESYKHPTIIIKSFIEHGWKIASGTKPEDLKLETYKNNEYLSFSVQNTLLSSAHKCNFNGY